MSAYDSVISKLEESYARGQSSGDLRYFSSTVEDHSDSGVDFEVRLCPSLAQKPPAPPGVGEGAVKKEHNPFLPPYVPGLYIDEFAEGDESYTALLNKYCVVEQHFLLVTKAFKTQTSPLNPDDLIAAYQLISAAKAQDRHFFMFYNCGPASGSSQKHKHMQFMPMKHGDGPPTEKLAKRQKLEVDGKAFSISSLPYSHHIIRLPSSRLSSEELSDILGQSYIILLDLTLQAFRHQANPPPGPPAYNVLLTLDHLHIIPRSQADYPMSGGGHLPVNALGFAGMLMVKSDAEKESLLKEGLLKVLRGVGLVEPSAGGAATGENGPMDVD